MKESSQEPIQGKIVLEEMDTQGSQDSLAPAQSLDESQWQAMQPVEEKPDELVYDDPTPVATKKGRKYLWWFVGVLLSLSLAELVLFAIEAYQQNDWLGSLWLALLGMGAVLIGAQGVREWRGLKRLKRQQHDQDKARQLHASPGIGQGKPFCLGLAQRLPEDIKANLTHWQGQLQPHHNDKETLALFEKSVLVNADKKALQIITGHAKASSAMIAVSPFALLDMAIVLWRNLKMLDQICLTYGITLSYWGKVTLIKSVFKTMLYAGASEILADAGGYALGSSITGKLSTRVAQGLGAGILTSRIGLKAMQTCRPLPFLHTDKPGLNGISAQLLSDLQKLTS